MRTVPANRTCPPPRFARRGASVLKESVAIIWQIVGGGDLRAKSRPSGAWLRCEARSLRSETPRCPSASSTPRKRCNSGKVAGRPEAVPYKRSKKHLMPLFRQSLPPALRSQITHPSVTGAGKGCPPRRTVCAARGTKQDTALYFENGLEQPAQAARAFYNNDLHATHLPHFLMQAILCRAWGRVCRAFSAPAPPNRSRRCSAARRYRPGIHC